MSLKRTVYRIAGKDYEAQQVVSFVFYVQRVSIENFLNINHVRRCVTQVNPFYVKDYHHTDTDGLMRAFTITAWASTMAGIFNAIGISDHHHVDRGYLYVRNINLRAPSRSYPGRPYNGISVYDPKTRTAKMTSNAPKKITGTQAIINGKLWRKYLHIDRPKLRVFITGAV